MNDYYVINKVDASFLPDFKVDFETGDKYIDVLDFCKFVNNVGKSFSDLYGCKFKLLHNNNNNSRVISSVNGLPRNLRSLGYVFTLYDNQFKFGDNKIYLYDFFNILNSMFHEGRHIEQYEHIFKSSEDKSLDLVSLNVIGEAMSPTHYSLRLNDHSFVNYYNIPMEVDAQVTALRRTFNFCKENYPNEDWISVLDKFVRRDFRFVDFYEYISSVSEKDRLDNISKTFKDALFASFIRYDDSYSRMVDSDIKRFRGDLFYEYGHGSFKLFNKFFSLLNIRTGSADDFVKSFSDSHSISLLADRVRSEIGLTYTKSPGLKCDNIKRAFTKVDSVIDDLIDIGNEQISGSLFIGSGISDKYKDLVDKLGINVDFSDLDNLNSNYRILCDNVKNMNEDSNDKDPPDIK